MASTRPELSTPPRAKPAPDLSMPRRVTLPDPCVFFMVGLRCIFDIQRRAQWSAPETSAAPNRPLRVQCIRATRSAQVRYGHSIQPQNARHKKELHMTHPTAEPIDRVPGQTRLL